MDTSGSHFSVLTSKVEFNDVHDQYSNQHDLLCKFKTNNYNITEGDRIGIYKSGWLYIKDYYLFDWTAPEKFTVSFNKNCLPKEDSEFYQFCYISVDNEVLGASEAFQFIDRKMSNTDAINTNDNLSESVASVGAGASSNYEKELQKLRDENEMLKESLKLFLVQKTPRNYDRDINELKSMIYSLKNVVSKQHTEIDFLKTQVRVCIDCNRNLLDANDELERQHQNCTNSVHSTSTNDSLNDYDVGELETIPPFPFAK